MSPGDQILEACVSAFFPGVPGRDKIAGLIKRQVFGGAAAAEIYRIDNRCSENLARLFCDTAGALRSNFTSWIQGMDNDVLSEFPAQRLIRVIDVREAVAWPTFWTAHGGRDFNGSMVALKWDPLWWKISAFNLPFPPFQLGSGYEVEDVDRDNAEALGFKIPRPLSATVNINIDVPDLVLRISAQLAMWPAIQPR